MTTSKQQLQDLEQILKLRAIRGKLHGADRQVLDQVIESLQQQVGATINKQTAARLLDVSRQSLDRWINAGLLPAVRGPLKNGRLSRQRIPRQALEELALEIGDLKNSGQRKALLADALRRLADELDSSEKRATANSKAAKTGGKKKTSHKSVAKKTNKSPKTVAKKANKSPKTATKRSGRATKSSK